MVKKSNKKSNQKLNRNFKTSNNFRKSNKDVSDLAVFILLILVILVGIVSLGVYLGISNESGASLSDNNEAKGTISLTIKTPSLTANNLELKSLSGD